MTVLLVVVALVVAIATYLTWTASRLDRLHIRVEASAAALDAELGRRAGAAATLAATSVGPPAGLGPGPLGAGLVPFGAGLVPPGLAGRLSAAAGAARSVAGLGPERERVENALSAALRDVLPGLPVAAEGVPAVGELWAAADRVAFARRFHNDAVSATLAVRARRIPRLAHLAGSAPLPAYFEIDDTVGSAATRPAPRAGRTPDPEQSTP